MYKGPHVTSIYGAINSNKTIKIPITFITEIQEKSIPK